jgi:hypothetical protein
MGRDSAQEFEGRNFEGASLIECYQRVTINATKTCQKCSSSRSNHLKKLLLVAMRREVTTFVRVAFIIVFDFQPLKIPSAPYQIWAGAHFKVSAAMERESCSRFYPI